jgi:hypothetical protein
VKAQAYTTLVRPVLEYASTVWDPYTPDVMGTGPSSSGGINLDVLMEWYFHQVVQDSIKHY